MGGTRQRATEPGIVETAVLLQALEVDEPGRQALQNELEAALPLRGQQSAADLR